MSSSRDGGGGEAEGVVIDITTTTTTTTEDIDATSIWEVARQNSSKMVLQSVMDDMEHRAAKQKEELQQFRRRAEIAESALLTSRQTVESLEASLLQQGETRKGLEKNFREASSETEVLKESIGTEKERADRLGAESDQLREEISRLSKSNESYQKQLAEAEAQAKLGDSSLLPLQFKNQRLETENDNLRTHSSWMEGELRDKSEELARLKSSTALDSAQARSNVDAARSERDEVVIEANQLREQLERVQTKAEGMSRELLDAKQEVSDVRLDSEEELTASRRLVDLQREQLLRLEQKHNGLARQMEAMKTMAGEAENEDIARWKEREQELKEVSQRFLMEKTEDYEHRLVSMQKEIEAANSRCKRAEDGLLLIEGPSVTKMSTRKALPPSQGNNDENDEPLGLTELYGRVAQAEDAFNAETIRRKKAEIRVARIEAEIQGNAPLLVRQRKEYELAMQNQNELQTRVEDALDEAAAFRNESNMLQDEVTRLRNEKKDLSEEGKELAQQVRDMLVARSSGVDNPNVALTVSQMQSANQRLLKEYRELTAKVKELEAKLQQEDLHKEVQDYKAELASLSEDRQRQEVIVESIVQQRDLYRTLLNKQDTNLLGGGDESSALAIVKGQSERAKVLEEQYRQLTKEHGEAQARLDVMGRDQEAASERLMRYEMLNNELTKSIDKASMEISKAKAAVARGEAEAVFYKDKAQMLEDAQQRNREEIKNVTASKNRIMVLNTDLEQSIFKANNESSRMQDQLRQAKSKLLLAEAEANSAKATEKRIAEESTNLRNELSRQGAVLDGVQRIESSLLLKNNTDIELYKLEVTTLKEKLSFVEKKQETVLNDLNGKIADQELEIKQLETSRANASKEALDAKKESLVSIQKAEAATKKSSVLERQLTIAKKKLGETGVDNEQDIESELRSKLETLIVDLEGSKKETETWKARSVTYEKLAKDNEAAVSAMTEASDATKKSLDENIEKLNKRLEHSDTEMAKRKEIITELTNDLSTQREARDKAVNEVKQQIAGFKADAEKHQKKAEDIEIRFIQLQKDINVINCDLAEAQINYERELALHAAVRTDLRTAREESENAKRARNTAMEEAATLQSKFKIHQSSLETEKSKRDEEEKAFAKKIEDSRAENTLLHAQLEKINDQIEKMQLRSTSDAQEADSTPEDISGDEEMMKLRMNVSELRELVKFVRAEKDSIQGQLDAARRSTERERTKASVARRATEETQAELKALKEFVENTSMNNSEGGTSMTNQLKATEDQSRLLGDSNAHLQQQVERLQSNLTSAQNELEISKSALQPVTDAQKESEADKAALLSEKESLLREINDWKGRVQSLVSRFNQVDPEEHAQIVKKAEELEKQVQSLEEKKASAEEEAKRIRTLASRASSQLSLNKQMVENQKKAIAKLTAEKAVFVKSQKESSSKKDLDELKEKILELEKKRETEAIQLKGSTTMNEKLRERMRQFQKTMVALKKEKELLTKQLTEARSISKKKEAEAAKAVATLKEKDSALAKNSAAAVVAAAPIEPAATNMAAKEKLAAAVPKQSAAAATFSTNTKTTIEKKEEKKVMPKVPPGGFKFAPSKTPISMGSIMAKTKNGTDPEKKEIANVSKKRPATDLGKQEAPLQKKPASGTQEKADGEPKTVKVATPTLKRPPPPTRRNSSEVKEMSLKDKLMEKKRKLMEMKKAKEAAKVEESNVPAPVLVEPDAKRNKTDSSSDVKAAETATSEQQVKPQPPSLSVKAAAFVPNASALKAAAASMTSKAAMSSSPKTNSSSEDGELNESVETPLNGQTPVIGSAASTAGSIFGGGAKAPTAFGSGFGSGSTSTFGKPSGFGSVGTGFGSSGTASLKSAFGFGGTKPEGGSAPASTTSSSSFGGAAFLNIKPPGSSSGIAPQFSFGSSGSSITLPTPGASSPNPNLSMFNAFASSAGKQPFGGQVSAKPLFGTIQEKEKDEEADDGEVPDTK